MAKAEDDFMATLQRGVRAVLKDPNAKAHEKVAACAAGAKLLMIQFKISGDDETSFFR